MAARYRFTLASRLGGRSEDLAAYLSADYVLAENEITALDMILPASEYDPDLFAVPDGRIYIERAASEALPLRLEGNTAWMIRKLDQFDSEDGTPLIELIAYVANYILDGAVIPYAAGQTGTPGSIKLGAGDNIIKAIIRENLGTLASDTARDLSDYLTVADDDTAAPVMLREFADRNVFEAISEIAAACAAENVWLGFHVSADPASGLLTFQTYPNFIGTDRTQGLIRHVVSRENGNLVNARYSEDWSEARTSIYAAGQSVATLRPMINVEDADAIGLSPFNRRELLITTNAPNSTALTDEANSAKYANRVKRTLTGDLIQTDDSVYGYHYFWGDLLPAEYRDRSFTARVSQVHITIRDKIDTVVASIRSDS